MFGIGIPTDEVKVKSLGAFSEADCILPFPEGGLSTETVASQVSPWLFVPFSFLTSLGKSELGNCYINAVWSWYERKLLLGNSSDLSAKARLVALGCPLKYQRLKWTVGREGT